MIPCISETITAVLFPKSFGCRNRYQYIAVYKCEKSFNAIASQRHLEAVLKDLPRQ